MRFCNPVLSAASREKKSVALISVYFSIMLFLNPSPHILSGIVRERIQKIKHVSLLL